MSSSMTRVVASGITRQMSRARPATGVSESRRAATNASRALTLACCSPGVSAPSGSVFVTAASRVFPPSAGPRRDYPIGADFAGNSRTRNVSFCHKNLHLAFGT